MSTQTTINERIRSRLNPAAGKNQAQLAKYCGVSTSAVAQWMTGKAGINYKHLPKIAAFLGVSMDWLVEGKGNPDDPISKLQPVGAFYSETPEPDGYVSIPEFHIAFGAGSEEPPTWEVEHESRKALYRIEFFQEHRVSPEQCRRVKVSGDSMEPTLSDGDTILIVDRPERIVDGAVYAFSIRNELMIKRLYRKADGSIVIHSDNERYTDETLTQQKQEEDFFRIYGRAIERTGAL